MPSVKIVKYLPDSRISTVTKECRHIVATRVKADSYAAQKCGMQVGYEIEIIGTDLGDEVFRIPGDADAILYFNAAGVMTDSFRIEKERKLNTPLRYDVPTAHSSSDAVPTQPQDQPETK